MSRRLADRLARIESTNGRGVAFAHQQAGETREEAIARHLAEHPGDRVRHIIVLDLADADA